MLNRDVSFRSRWRWKVGVVQGKIACDGRQVYGEANAFTSERGRLLEARDMEDTMYYEDVSASAIDEYIGTYTALETCLHGRHE